MGVAYRAARAASLGRNPVGRRGAPGKGAPGAPGDMPGLGGRLPSRGFRRRQGRQRERQARPPCIGEYISQPLEGNAAFSWLAKSVKWL